MKKGCSHKVVEVLSESASDSVRFDAKIALTGTKTKVSYPENLRMVKYHDSGTDKDVSVNSHHVEKRCFCG